MSVLPDLEIKIDLPKFPIYGSAKCPTCGSDGDTKRAECREASTPPAMDGGTR